MSYRRTLRVNAASVRANTVATFLQRGGLKLSAQLGDFLNLLANIFGRRESVHMPSGEAVQQSRPDGGTGRWAEENAAGDFHGANGLFCVAPGWEPSVRPKSTPVPSRPWPQFGMA